MIKDQQFGFGIEAEFLLLDRDSGRAFLPHELDADELLEIIESIDCKDVGSDGLNLKPLHHSHSPYLVEGYYIPQAPKKGGFLIPKGLEIRTPTRKSIEE